ncbi:MAG: hypothetical protein NZ924_02925 [Candidatus Bipolaricaulota bacterium]|nr:hypothetical protein [Candidatus Bipolaricaulota bacterium]MDW8151859.1 hypothetical protein [Candidatus Bipolaricaulota bacterium]
MRRILGVFLAIGLLGATLGFAQDRLGVGGSFALGSPVLDVFLEFPARDTATRFTLGIWALAPGGNMAFSVDASLLFARVLGGFDVYFGGGAGGVAVVAGGLGGVAAISLTVNALGGAYFPVNETFALYGHIKLLGLVNLATMSINALLMPGFGLCVAF